MSTIRKEDASLTEEKRKEIEVIALSESLIKGDTFKIGSHKASFSNAIEDDLMYQPEFSNSLRALLLAEDPKHILERVRELRLAMAISVGKIAEEIWESKN